MYFPLGIRELLFKTYLYGAPTHKQLSAGGGLLLLLVYCDRLVWFEIPTISFMLLVPQTYHIVSLASSVLVQVLSIRGIL